MKRFLKKLPKLIRGNFISAAFLVVMAAGMVSASVDFGYDAVTNFFQADHSVIHLAGAMAYRLLDIRGGKTAFTFYTRLKGASIYLYGLSQRAVGNDYIYDANPVNDVVRMTNGYLTVCCPALSDEKVNQLSGRISAFAEELSGEGVGFCYVQLPYKVCAYDKRLPAGVSDYGNENADRTLAALRENAVDTLDLRARVREAGLDHYALFFRTDHHWTPSAALWGAREICEKLNADYGYQIDASLLDADRFSQTVYPALFLGSLGRRVGKYYAGTDDFTLLVPRYETDMAFSVLYHSPSYPNSHPAHPDGSFEAACLVKKRLEKDYMKSNTYTVYSGGDYGLTKITNKNLSGGRILLIRDSFSCTAAPFLALAACRELYTIDLRYNTGSTADCVRKYNPDTVILMINPSMLGAYNDFNFYEGV